AGAFREDLLYRIQEYSLRIPPLRERAQLEAFILQLWRELGGERRDIRLLPEALAMLARYPWPGNVRQLLSTLKVLLALADDHAVLTLDDLPQSIAVLAPRQDNADTGLEALQAAIGRAGGNLSRAAKALGVSRSTLYRKLGKQKAAAE
ncbi:sigma-54-dependent Fis family transcriptional regulator, partial [Serratia marcescens]